MKFKDEIINQILDKSWNLLIEERGGGSYHCLVYFERYLNQIIIKDCGNRSIYDFATLDNLVVTKIDNEKVILSSKKSDDEHYIDWILLEVEDSNISQVVDNWLKSEDECPF